MCACVFGRKRRTTLAGRARPATARLPHPSVAPLSSLPLPTLTTDLQRNSTSQQTFVSQRHENEMVLAELERVTDGDAVFKLTGGALLKQDPSVAVATVRKRLDYIGVELERLEGAATDLTSRAEKAQARVAAAQAEAVKAQAAAAGGGQAQKA